jgi:hypothetical protein
VRRVSRLLHRVVVQQFRHLSASDQRQRYELRRKEPGVCCVSRLLRRVLVRHLGDLPTNDHTTDGKQLRAELNQLHWYLHAGAY